MKKKKIHFFTVNDFTHSSGGSLRMVGILNTLASFSHIDINLYSNIKKERSLDDNISHKNVDVSFSAKEKRLFQFFVALFPLFIVDLIFFNKMKKLRNFFIRNNLIDENIIFFEFLDNSIGYYLKKKSLIKSYTNDIHGMAPNEFKNKIKNKLSSKLYNGFRYYVSILLDKKVFNYADGLIFASNSMKEYYLDLYHNLENKHLYILPYVLEDNAFNQVIDFRLRDKIKLQYKIESTDEIIFYAGGFKEMGGILDLIDAYIIVKDKRPNSKLFILGKGNLQNRIEMKIKENNLENNVILAGTIPYIQLRTYQELANVIVCPDRQNYFSNLIIHLKYFDSLLSGKIVINGSFDAVLELNNNEDLSVNFEPSSIENLALKIIYSLRNYKQLNSKYNKNKKLTFFKYSEYYDEMLKL